MIQNLGGEYNTPSTSNQQQQPKLFNRMSAFFQKQQQPRSLLQDEYQEASSSNHSAMVTSSIGGAPSHYAPSQYSAMDEDTASRVDSMFSSLQSNRSNMRPNPNTPPPLRTVRLDGVANNNNNNSGMIQPLRGAPPSPPEQSYHHPFPSSSQSSSLNQSKNNNNNDNLSNPETIEQQFEKIVREYELPDELIKTLTLEKKQELLRNSRVQQNKNNQSLFSWKTLGFQKKQKNRMDIRQEELFDPNDHNSNNNNNNNSSNSNNKKRNHGNYFNDNKSYSTSARGKAQRASVMNPYQKDDKNATIKYDRTMKKGLSPEYFIHVLKDAHVRDLDESLVQDLRVCLRSVKASWTTQFLDLGGYSVISNLFYQMKEAPKRYPNDDKILQHLSKCFKAIMTHKQRGVNLVLTNPIGLVHIRDLLFDLFGANNQKQKELYGLHIITRGHFLNILCSLTNLQTTPSETVPYIHGYDILRRLLLDNSSDYYGETVSTSTSSTSIANTSPSSTSPSPSTSKTNHPASSSAAAIKENNNELPFRMTLKQDPEVIMKMILENDPLYIDGQPFKPRYTAWMRELDYTVEKEIGTITYLSQALDYRFESAFRQMRIKPPTPEQDQINEINNQHGEEEEEATGVVMTDDGVVDYLIAHLRLINTIIGSQPTFCDTPYTDRDKEKVRLEIMMSGFDKTSKLLQNCPHPTLLAFYIPFLRTLLHPLADLSLEQQQANMQTVYHQNNTAGISTNDTTTSQQWNENELRQTYEHPTWSNNSFYDDDDEDEENWVDEDESFDYSFDEQMDEYDSQLGDEDDMSTYDREHRWKTGSSVTR